MFRRYVTTSDLAAIIPIFPLTGVVLLPRGNLPLNIFEPRYLKMVDDAMRGTRLIGIVQPRIHESHEPHPPVFDVGGIGRVTSYSETDDARFHITLTGLCRFRIAEELSVATPYRQVKADYAPFADDLADASDDELPADQRAHLIEMLRSYLSARNLSADWDSIRLAPSEHLVNALAMICPFEAPEKQALLEARTLVQRAEALIALIAMSGPDAPPSAPSGSLQ